MLDACHAAILRGDTEVALSLIHQLPEDQRNKCGMQGYNALHLAIKTEDVFLVSALLPLLELHTLTASGKNVVHLAAARGNIQLFKQLYSAGANMISCTPQGDTALHIAAKSLRTYSVVWVKELLKVHPAALNAVNLAGETPLMLACQQGKTTFVFELWRYGAVVPSAPFIEMLAITKPQLARELRQLSRTQRPFVKFSPPPPKGSQALYAAVKAGAMQVIQQLFEDGADPLAPCGYPDTPFQLAKKLGNKEAIALFKTIRLPDYPDASSSGKAKKSSVA